MGIVDCRENAPKPINLGVVPVDFRNDQKHGEKKQGEGECGDEGIGGNIEDFERLKVGDVLEDLQR